MKKLQDYITISLHFIKTDIWRIRLEDLPKQRSFLIKQLRIILLSFKGFDEDKCQLRASALTFYSLLSIVPVVAMIFGIAKGFGMEELLEKRLHELFADNQTILTQVLTFSRSLLESTKGGLIAGVGIVVLFWSVMKVLGNIELSFNEIWEIKRPRNFLRKFSDYLSIMLIAPVLLIMSSSTTVIISDSFSYFSDKIALLGYFSWLIAFFIKLVPYFLLWVVFTFMYMIMPNTRVNFKSALIAGIIAGSIFQLTQWGFFTFEVGVAKYNKIYGSFAALPLFLAFVQVGWLIVLFGAEISFANQNVDRYEFEIESGEISNSFKRTLSILIAHTVVKTFEKGEQALTVSQIANNLEIPVRIVRQIVYNLTECNILSEVNTNNNNDFAYQPAQDINKMTIQNVIASLDEKGIADIPVAETKELKEIKSTIESFNKNLGLSKSNKLLMEIG